MWTSLFRDFLRARLTGSDPERERRLHRSAARWYAEHDYLDDAMHHSMLVSTKESVALLEENAMQLIEHSRMVALLRLAHKLPAGHRESSAQLMLALSWANCLLQRVVPAQLTLDHLRVIIGDTRQIGDPAAVEAGDTAAATGGETDETAELLGDIDVMQAAIDVFRDDLDRVVELVTPTLAAVGRKPFVSGVAANVMTVEYLHRGEFARARQMQVQVQARVFHNRAVGPFVGVYGRCLAGMAAFEQLDLDAAEFYLEDALDFARSQAGSHSHAAYLAGAMLGELSLERGISPRPESCCRWRVASEVRGNHRFPAGRLRLDGPRCGGRRGDRIGFRVAGRRAGSRSKPRLAPPGGRSRTRTHQSASRRR